MRISTEARAGKSRCFAAYKKNKLPEVARKMFENFKNILLLNMMIAVQSASVIAGTTNSEHHFVLLLIFQTLEDNTVTVRDRDNMQQKRIKIEETMDFWKEKLGI